MPPNAFLALPSGIKLTGSAKFFPATMLPDPGSFNASLDLGEIHAVYDRIKPLLSARQAMKPVPPAFPEDILSDSDREGNTPMLTPGTPASPKSSALSPRIPSLEALSVKPFLYQKDIVDDDFAGLPMETEDCIISTCSSCQRPCKC